MTLCDPDDPPVLSIPSAPALARRLSGRRVSRRAGLRRYLPSSRWARSVSPSGSTLSPSCQRARLQRHRRPRRLPGPGQLPPWLNRRRPALSTCWRRLRATPSNVATTRSLGVGQTSRPALTPPPRAANHESRGSGRSGIRFLRRRRRGQSGVPALCVERPYQLGFSKDRLPGQ